MSIPSRAIRLRAVEIDGVKIERQLLPEEMRAFCVICQWGGPWRSIWSTWDEFVLQIKEDLQEHLAKEHV